MIRLRWLLPALLAAAATGPAIAGFKEIEGTAGYDERTALPPDAILEVRLLEQGQADAAAPPPIAAVSIRVLGASPFPFRLTFDEAMVDPKRSYALDARIRRAEETVFEAAEATPIFTGMPSGPPEIRMVRAEPPGGPPEPGLERSEWVLTEMAAGRMVPSSPARVKFGEESEAGGTGGCNDFQSSYRVDPPKGLSFGKLETTLRGCTAELAQQDRLVFRAIGRTRGYEIDDDGRLVLRNERGEELLRFEQQR